MARELGHLGAQVIIASRKAENIEPAAAGLSKEIGREVVGLTCDIRDRDNVAAFVQQVMDRFGKIDVLINNAGGQFFSPADGISPKGWMPSLQRTYRNVEHDPCGARCMDG